MPLPTQDLDRAPLSEFDSRKQRLRSLLAMGEDGAARAVREITELHDGP